MSFYKFYGTLTVIVVPHPFGVSLELLGAAAWMVLGVGLGLGAWFWGKRFLAFRAGTSLVV